MPHSIFDPTGLTLPDFFLIGPFKSGKEDLEMALRSHQDVSVPIQTIFNDTWFSENRNWRQGLGIYALQFVHDADFSGRVSGDTVHGGLGSLFILFRMQLMNPTAKIVILLRDPTERWLDQYSFVRDRRNANFTRQKMFDEVQQSLSFGVYLGHLKDLFSVFPASQVLIEFTERMKGDETVRTKLIFDFLGVDDELSFTPEPFDDAFEEDATFRTKLNAIYKPALPELKRFLTDLGFDASPIDNWTRPAPTAPATTNDFYITEIDVQLDITATGAGVLANDFDVNGDPTTAILDTTPGDGSITMNSNGTFSYLPDSAFAGTDTFTYHANDGVLNSTPVATVTIDVKPPTNAPVANPDNFLAAPNGTLTVATPGLLENDTKVQGTLTAVKDTDPSNGTITVNSNGSFTYIPNQDFFGDDSFTYHNNDGTNSSSIVTAAIRIDF